MVKVLLGIVLAVCAANAGAQNVLAVSKQVENSMLVAGTVDIDRDGSVTAYTIDKREEYPDYVVDIVDRAASRWRFEPILVDGESVQARADMTLRLVAKKQSDGDYLVSIASANFEESDVLATDHVAGIAMPPPTFPEYARERSAWGTVYLILKIGRDGSVEDAFVEQVNLAVVAKGREMDTLRDRFARSALAAARGWTFSPPTTGKDVDADFWEVRVPVEYSFREDRRSVGQWLTYVPGPRQVAPWRRSRTSEPEGNDAMVAGRIEHPESGHKLLTSLE